MRFSRLKLSGFKSFVDPTDLVISEGLTGVVGPNGCGKSNLLEALRWVMGENRPTAMRGGGMEDVIFAGAESRPARNFAEVCLMIDNSDRLAPQGFNDADSVEIVRRITRDAGSAYKANGRDVRARDVQMLFADASTGSQSPALVRQGQISELINAKPRNRRRILEEAAGISGLYARRHEAELKLNGAEQNLARLDDVIEQLAQQLAQLERQARQASRYRAIGAELRAAEGALLYRRWRDSDAARAEAAAALRDRADAAARAEADVRRAAAARVAAEEAVPPRRDEATIAAALVQRLTSERAGLDEREARAADTIAALRGRIAHLARDRAREVELNRDAGETIARLEAEAQNLAAAGSGHDAALAAAAEAAREAAVSLQDREGEQAQLTEDVARLAARHQSSHRFRDDSRRALDRSTAEAAKARAAVDDSRGLLAVAGRKVATAEAEAGIARRTAVNAEDTLAVAEAARAGTQGREADARAERSAAEGEMNALRAEVTALARLVARDTAEGGQVMDMVKVRPGYEKALGAALADDLRAPVVAADGPSGWTALGGYDRPQPLPPGVAALAAFVDVPPVLARRIAQIGVVEAEAGPAAQARLLPGQRLVSAEGDLWRWDGFRAWAEDAPSAAALRLQQMNRLEELKQDLERAGNRADGARDAHDHLAARLAQLAGAETAARQARRDADRLLTEASRAQSRAGADLALAESRLESLDLAVARHEDDARGARAQLAEAERALADLGDLDLAREAVERIKLAVEGGRMAMMSRRAAHDELRREGEARRKRSGEVARELATWRDRLANAGQRLAELEHRRTQSEAELAQAEDVPATLAEERASLDRALSKAEARQTAAATALAAAEAALRDTVEAERTADRGASDARAARAAAEARADAAADAVQAAADRIAEQVEETPQQLLARLALDPETLPKAEAIEAEAAALRRQRDAMGAVNLRAEDDMTEVSAEHGTLVQEKSDLDEAIRTLREAIASLNREGRERLLTAFEQVNDNFGTLFGHLFGGGDARLELVESDDPLEAGLEIMCQPPGKKLSTLSLLSGGEQTLTALALIFAVFLANPAPICVLDEVDAPLDDANVTRFCDLLDEMCRRTDTRFLIITHHAVTMARMDRLFGVTMAERGVSQLVSVDLRRAETLVA